ncbi:MAG: RHS repeat-associated core domain-containing protein, partial [Candidatus Eisenbacteria bacterium]|nr:RHS repeat-associated core domain-containing protein [Candidatus Eisenbacteria bacterium]
LLYYGYRYYSPELGRWLSRDPIGERGGRNLYVAIRNNPIDRWDLLGLITIDNASATEAVKNDSQVRADVELLKNNMLAKRSKECAGKTGVEVKDFDSTAESSSASSVAFMYNTRYVYLGQVGVSLSGSGKYEVDCCLKKFKKWVIQIDGSFSDEFDELLPSPWGWWGSLPFTFVGSWVESFKGEG